MKNATRAVLALALGILLMPLLAMAQAVTPNSACGASATGYKYGTREPITLDAAAAQYLQVGPDGAWRFCRPPPAPARAPADCTPPQPLTWGEGAQTCTGTAVSPIKHGATVVARTAAGPADGVLVLQCTDGTLSVRVATCDETAECVGSYTGSDDGGQTQWHWSGRLKEGARGVATAGVRTRPIECRGGRLRLSWLPSAAPVV